MHTFDRSPPAQTIVEPDEGRGGMAQGTTQGMHSMTQETAPLSTPDGADADNTREQLAESPVAAGSAGSWSPRRPLPLNHYSLGIVDNDPLVLDLLARSFTTVNAPLHVRWSFTDPHQAWLACDDESTCPQVVLTDIEMPGMNGRELFRRLRASHPNVVVIGISAFPDSVAEPGLVVLPKESRIEEIVHLAGMLLHDESLICWYELPAQINPLSPSELQTVDHYAQGKTTLCIAHTMHVSESSVKTFVKRACKKLGVHSRTEAIVMCVHNNWI